MWQTHGHKNQKLFLENHLRTRKFAHAYLFAGPEQIGKKTLALEFANRILGENKLNPDLMLISEEKYKIENIRDLIAELSLKPFYGQYKVAILDNFELATLEAANSILKTLEEPSPSTIIILVSKNSRLLLPTIVSRTQILTFNRLPEEELLKIEKFAGFDKDILKFMTGRVGLGYDFLNNAEWTEQLRNELKDFQELKKAKAALRLAKIKKYSDLDSGDLKKILGKWLDQEYAEFKEQLTNYNNVRLLSESLGEIDQNLNKKLVLQKLMLNLN